MVRISVLGGTGYVGSAIAREAATRGHDVVVFSRSAPTEDFDGVTSVTGSASNRADIERAIVGADVVVVALAPSDDIAENFEQVNRDIADIARESNVRLGVVGGAGSLLSAPDGPKVYETDAFPEQFRAFASRGDAILQVYLDSDPALDWFVLSPPLIFGRHIPGTATGQYRLGGDVMLTDSSGSSAISGQDFALAFVDEIDKPVHRRRRFTVAY